MVLTTKNIESMYSHRDWSGYGYLACRSRLKPHFRVGADRMLLDWANEHGLTVDELFAFMDSRNGRFYGNSWEDGGKNAHNHLPTVAEIREWMKIRL